MATKATETKDETCGACHHPMRWHTRQVGFGETAPWVPLLCMEWGCRCELPVKAA